MDDRHAMLICRFTRQPHAAILTAKSSMRGGHSTQGLGNAIKKPSNKVNLLELYRGNWEPQIISEMKRAVLNGASVVFADSPESEGNGSSKNEVQKKTNKRQICESFFDLYPKIEVGVDKNTVFR